MPYSFVIWIKNQPEITLSVRLLQEGWTLTVQFLMVETLVYLQLHVTKQHDHRSLPAPDRRRPAYGVRCYILRCLTYWRDWFSNSPYQDPGSGTVRSGNRSLVQSVALQRTLFPFEPGNNNTIEVGCDHDWLTASVPIHRIPLLSTDPLEVAGCTNALNR